MGESIKERNVDYDESILSPSPSVQFMTTSFSSFSSSGFQKGDWLWERMAKYNEFPALVPPIVARESDEPRKPAGGHFAAGSRRKDLHEYQRIATYLERDPSHSVRQLRQFVS